MQSSFTLVRHITTHARRVAALSCGTGGASLTSGVESGSVRAGVMLSSTSSRLEPAYASPRLEGEESAAAGCSGRRHSHAQVLTLEWPQRGWLRLCATRSPTVGPVQGRTRCAHPS